MLTKIKKKGVLSSIYSFAYENVADLNFFVDHELSSKEAAILSREIKRKSLHRGYKTYLH